MNTALLSTFLWALFFFCCPDPGWTTQAEDTVLLEMETKMTNIMDRMRRMEADMEARDKRISLLEDSVETKDQRITRLPPTLETQMKAKEVEMKRLRGRMKETEETDL